MSSYKLIEASPFVADGNGDWSFTVKDPATGNTISTSIDPMALFASLGEKCGSEPLMTCGCSIAECARIYEREMWNRLARNNKERNQC